MMLYYDTVLYLQCTVVRMEVASSRPDHLPTQSSAKTSELSLLVKLRFWWRSGRCRHCCSDFCFSMPALLLRLLLQYAGDIEMNPGLDSTPTPTNCLRLKQWNANRISGRMNELLTFLHSNNVNIVAIQETKLTNKTKPLKTPGWAAVRLYRHKIKVGDLLMLIKDTIPFVDNTATLAQSADPHLEQQGISITLPNRQQLHIHNIYIPSCRNCSAGHNALIAHLLCINKMSLIVGDINALHSRKDTNANKDKIGEQLATMSMQPARPFLMRMRLRDYREIAGQLRPTSVLPPITSHYYQTGQSLPHWPAIICPSSSPSTPNCP